MRDEPRPPRLAVRCKDCQTPVVIENDAVMTHAVRHGIMCGKCRGGAEPVQTGVKWTKATYAAYLQSEHWQRTRAKALRRAGNKCQLCAATEELHVHHNDYTRLGGELATDLVVLCSECHRTHHGVFD